MDDSANPAPHPRAWVADRDGVRTLRFSADAVQSTMRLDDPDALDLAYTRAMMAFVLWWPQPRRIGLIGLGGGSLLKFCHRHLPQAHLQVAEINPQVLALREAFRMPPDSQRLSVHAMDGALFVRLPQASFEVLLLDGFDEQGMPESLCSQRFLDDAMLTLDEGGLMVINLHLDDPRLPLIMDRLARSFEGEASLLVLDDAEGANRLVLACRGREFRHFKPGPPVGIGLQLAADFAPVRAAWRRAALADRHSPPL